MVTPEQILQLLPQKRHGVFISVEGCDGTGKTTQAKRLVGLLNEVRADSAIFTREPGGSQYGEIIRQSLIDRDDTDEPMHPTTLLLQFLSLRWQNITRVVLPALRAGKIVITDRFIDSTTVHNSLMDGQGVKLQELYRCPSWELLRLRPDYTFFYETRKEVSQARMQARGTNQFDLRYAQAHSHWLALGSELRQRFGSDVIKRICADGTLDEVFDLTQRSLLEALTHFGVVHQQGSGHLAYVHRSAYVSN